MNEGRLYVLKVWPEPGRFRADLRAVEEVEVLRFEGVQRLCEHIASLASAPAGAPHTNPAAPDAASTVTRLPCTDIGLNRSRRPSC